MFSPTFSVALQIEARRASQPSDYESPSPSEPSRQVAAERLEAYTSGSRAVHVVHVTHPSHRASGFVHGRRQPSVAWWCTTFHLNEVVAVPVAAFMSHGHRLVVASGRGQAYSRPLTGISRSICHECLMILRLTALELGMADTLDMAGWLDPGVVLLS